MNIRIALLALALFPLCLAATPVEAADALKGNGHQPFGNRIVGLWLTQGEVRPCGSALPFNQVRNTLLFNAHGTWVETPVFPPGGVANVYNVAGINQRTQALGTWSYSRHTGTYTGQLRFDWYVDGMYHGYQTVDREITLSHDGNTASGPVRTTRYAADGSIVVELCGSAVSTRQ